MINVKRSNGFTYLGLLFCLILIGITLALAGTLWSFTQKREQELQLIFVGNQFKRAISLYYQRSPEGIKQYPSALSDLLEDKRYVSKERYLRRIYNDPITNSTDWGLVLSPEGGIIGVYSLSQQAALRKIYPGVFSLPPKGDIKYSDLKFIYTL